MEQDFLKLTSIAFFFSFSFYVLFFEFRRLNEGEFLYQIAHLILLYFNQLEEF